MAAVRSWSDPGPKRHAVRWRRSSSTTTTMACWICSCCRNGPRTCSAMWALAGPEVTEAAALPALASDGVAFQAMALGDVDGDGDTDALVRLTDGTVRHWRNQGGNRNPSLRVRLAGRVSNRSGVGSKVDMRAGSLRQRLESSATTPSVAPSDLVFGLGAHRAADVVRVLWPSGTLQAETGVRLELPARRSLGESWPQLKVVTVTELDRKPSSCPDPQHLERQPLRVRDRLHGWRGDGLLGRTGNVEPAGSDQVRPHSRRPARAAENGRYELRVTNELEEAMFVDRLQLVAVDHADGRRGISERRSLVHRPGASPHTSGIALTATRGARAVAAATDEHGHDVRERLERIDRKDVDDFSPVRYADMPSRTP